MEIVMNPLTGLPELPEGYYWKVTTAPEPFGNQSQVLVLMQERYRRNGKRARKDKSVDFKEFESVYLPASWEFEIDTDKTVEENRVAYQQHIKESIQQVADMILKRQYRSLVRVALTDEREKFYGNYPPKSL